MLNIRDFGAVADGKTVNTKAIQAAVDRAGETGETVLVPGGVFITGTIHLNGASLHLEPDAVLKGSTNIDDYPAQDFIHNEMGVLRALLINRDHDNVTIDGSGTIDLSGITDWAKPCEDIVITNCVLRSCSKAIVIGYSYSHIRNVTITNCIIKESNRGICFMCNDTSALVENVRISNMIVDTRVRAGNWWGNGEPIFMMAVKHDYLIPAEQDPHRETDCAIRNVHIDGVTCMGENAMGIYGVDGNIREVELRNIDFTRKPSKNLPLKGNVFDFAPGRVDFEVPEDCGLYIGGGADVKLENINTRAWKIIHA